MDEDRIETLKQAFDVAGFSYDDIDSSEDYIHFNGDALHGNLAFQSWEEAEQWINNVELDTPEMDRDVELVLHPDVFQFTIGLYRRALERAGYHQEESDSNDLYFVNDEPDFGSEHFKNWLEVEKFLDDPESFYDLECYWDIQNMLHPERNQEDRTISDEITDDSDHIQLDGLDGRWYVIDSVEHNGREYFLLESEKYGDATPNVVIDKDKNVLVANAYNGLLDAEVEEAMDIAEGNGAKWRFGIEMPSNAQELSVLKGDYNEFIIYQLPADNPKAFLDLEALDRNDMYLYPKDYLAVYISTWKDTDNLDMIYHDFNVDDRPNRETSRSLSVGDIIVVNQPEKDGLKAYFVDSMGFSDYSEFIKGRLDMLSQNKALEGNPLNLPEAPDNEKMFAQELSAQIWMQTGCLENVGFTVGDGHTIQKDSVRDNGAEIPKEASDRIAILSNQYAELGINGLKSLCGDSKDLILKDTELTDQALFIRIQPDKPNGQLTFYLYNEKDDPHSLTLSSYIKDAEKGVRFLDGDYQEKFTVSNGGLIRVEEPRFDGGKYIDDWNVWYIDPSHFELQQHGREGHSRALYHSYQYAEHCALGNLNVYPISEQEADRPSVLHGENGIDGKKEQAGKETIKVNKTVDEHDGR